VAAGSILAFFDPPLDYEFVIPLSGGRDSGRPKFIAMDGTPCRPFDEPQGASAPYRRQESRMNRIATTFAAALVVSLAAASSAYAAPGNRPQSRQAPLTRAEVIAQIPANVDRGVWGYAESMGPTPVTPSRITRAEARAQISHDVDRGTLGWSLIHQPTARSTLTRSEVRAQIPTEIDRGVWGYMTF
jgi:hypothetical protein